MFGMYLLLLNFDKKNSISSLPSIVFDRDTNRPKGFGFCEFQDQQGAQNAIDTMNGVELNGRALRVNWANK
jgi:RNA recognition motif-containing protein